MKIKVKLAKSSQNIKVRMTLMEFFKLYHKVEWGRPIVVQVWLDIDDPLEGSGSSEEHNIYGTIDDIIKEWPEILKFKIDNFMVFGASPRAHIYINVNKCFSKSSKAEKIHRKFLTHSFYQSRIPDGKCELKTIVDKYSFTEEDFIDPNIRSRFVYDDEDDGDDDEDVAEEADEGKDIMEDNVENKENKEKE